MNCTLSNFIIFVAGAAVGSLATWKYVKTKYERIANEEIAEMREYVNSRGRRAEANVIDEAMNDEDKREFKKKIEELGYTSSFNTLEDNEEEKEMDDTREPYVIMPDQFSEYADYDTISLTYYADGVLADDMDEIIEDVDEVVGEDSLNHFGEFEEDSVYVRNDERKCDYEILRDNRNYADVVGTN